MRACGGTLGERESGTTDEKNGVPVWILSNIKSKAAVEAWLYKSLEEGDT